MKKLLAAALAMVMAVSGANLPALAADRPAKAATAVGDLTAAVRLDYPESLENITKRALNLRLSGEAGEIFSIELTPEKETEKLEVNGNPVQVTVTPLNEQNVEITTENTIGYYEVLFQGLPNNQSYTVSLEGRGYQSYGSAPIELKDYSRKILIGAWEGGFALGDADGNGSIGNEDLSAVRENLGKTAAQSDLTMDGKVDIEDLALAHINQGPKGEAVLFETAAIASAVVETEKMEEELKEAGVAVEGSLEDLFLPNGEAVTLTPTEGKPIVLPISFEENPVETQEIQITSPQGDGAIEAGTAEVEYVDEDGKTKTGEFPFEAPAMPQGIHAIKHSSGSTLVIDLGKRVAVKKVTIKVEKVQGGEGYAVVENIQFLKDIVPDNTEITNAIPLKVTAVAGSEAVSLSWRAVDNVDGYIVSWGEKAGPQNYTKELKVSQTKAEISGLENLTTYYFSVQSYTEDGWKSGYSAEVSAEPQPSSVPPAPDYVTVVPQDQALTVSWKETENALTYSLYYKETAQPDSAYQKAADKLTATSYAVGGLENNVSYDVYVTASNNLGEGPRSLVAQGTPERQLIEAPVLPEENRIPNSAITSIKMTAPANVDQSQYPNGFQVGFVADGDYYTHWTARRWWESKEFVFEFDEEKSMNYLIYVPRLDGLYANSLSQYSITAWDAQGNKYNLTRDGGDLEKGPAIKNNVVKDRYAILPFERNDHIKKLAVQVRQWNGSPTNVSLSEIAFYQYNGIEDDIDALFTDGSKTQLSKTATEEAIELLQSRLDATGNFYIDKDILQDELDLARSLLAGEPALGLVKEGLFSISTKGDVTGFSTLQPLGAVAQAGQTVAIYANIPQGETVSLVPTQYFAEAKGWSGSPITLENGRNIVHIPTLTSLNTEKGGSLYLQYSGNHGEDVKLHVRGKGVTPIPTLELYNWESLSEAQRKEKIEAYTQALNSHVASLSKEGIETNIRNATEISLPNVLLSLPASTVQQGTSGASATVEEQAQRLYQNALAWEQMMHLMYRTHGVDDPEQQQSRNNIRYHRMFAGAFMYAAGAHIGVGYGSTAGLVLGQPVNGEAGLFGWGIAHEIGHNMDTLGRAETTNNIYSLFAQTFDGQENTGTSRLEVANKYPQVFDKTSSGAKGLANDVFTQLAMYWQLHLAYDGAEDNFYNALNKAYRSGSGEGFEGDEKFAVVASQVSGYDLTEFFTQWGVELSNSARTEMARYKKESRKLHYLSDESRRQRLKGAQEAQGHVAITASSTEKEVTVNIDAQISSGNIQGYEILRNGKPHAFVPAGQPPVFTEIIGSSNNKTMEYQVKIIDILGNVVGQSNECQVSIQHNNVIDRDLWDVEAQEDGTLLVYFTESTRLSGIVFKNMDGLLEDAQKPDQGDENAEPQPQPEEETPTPEEGPQEEQPQTGEDEDPEETDPQEEDLNTDENNENGEATGPEDGSAEETPDNGHGSAGPVDPAPEDAEEEQEQEQEPEPENEQEALPEQALATASLSEGAQDEEGSQQETPENDPTQPETGDGPPNSEDQTEEDPQNGQEGEPNEEPQEGSGEGSGENGQEPGGSEENKEEQPDLEDGSNEVPQEEEGPSQQAKGQVIVEVRENGENFRHALTIDLAEIDLADPANALQLFNGGDTSGKVQIFDEAEEVRITGLPSTVTKENFDLAGYPGDSIEFMEGAIGRLSHDYQYGDETEIIPEGTLIIAGAYRGDPVYSTIRIKGEFLEGDPSQPEAKIVERPINGDVYLFAQIPEAGALSEINNGIWIFVPNVQAEQELQENMCNVSVLPGRIQAELYRTDDPENPDSKRLTSNTKWISSPSEDTMPSITLQGE